MLLRSDITGLWIFKQGFVQENTYGYFDYNTYGIYFRGTILPGLFDTVAATIVILNMVTKIMFGNEGLIGKVPEGDSRFGLMSKNKWLPHMTYGHGYSFWLFGGSVGFIAAYLVYVLSEFSKTVDNPMIAGVSFVPVWAITVVFLILMCCGLPCPVLHHIGLVGAYGGQMAYNAGCSEISVLLWGFAFGIFAHYAGDLLADLFLVYGEGYVDPPSLSMLFCSVFAFVVCPALGLVNPDSPISVIAPVMIIIAFAVAAVITEGKLKKAEA